MKNSTFALPVIAVLLPLCFTSYVPLNDLPGHMTRAHVITHYAESAHLQQVFEGWQHLAPNQASDRVVPLLLRFLPSPLAGRVFVGILLVLFSLGCWLLGKAFHGRPTWGAALAVFVVYNSLFFYGFVNFMFSTALFFVCLALWLFWRRQWTVWRWSATAAVACAVYLAHLGGFLFLGLSIAVLSLLELRTKSLREAAKQWLRDAVPFLPAVVLFFQRTTAVSDELGWSSLQLKAVHAFIAFIAYDRRVDAVVLVTLAIAALVLFLKGRVTFQPQASVLAAVFWVCFAVFPGDMMSGNDADTRCVVPAMVFSLLAVQVTLPVRLGRTLLVAALGACLLRVAAIGAYWHATGPRIAAQVELFSMLPMRARLYPMFWPYDHKQDAPLMTVAQYAAISSDAITPIQTARNVSILWMRTYPWYENYNEHTKKQPDWDRLSAETDYIWAYKMVPSIQQELDRRFVLVGTREAGRLYRVQR